MLNQDQLEALDARISSNADRLILAYQLTHREATAPLQPLTAKGRKPNMLQNTIIPYIGKTTEYGLYAPWALDVIEGIARLDWDSKPTDSPLKSSPLSVRSLCIILASLESITAKDIEALLGIGKRHAQRYLKACTLAMPYLERSIPKPRIRCIEWLDMHDLIPDPTELARLEYDMRTF